MWNNQDSLNEAEMDEMLCLLDSCLSASLSAFLDDTQSGTGTGLTEKQLRALSKKHLLMMIYDLEKELAQEKKEKEFLLRAR